MASRQHRTDKLASPPDATPDAQRSGTMSNSTESMPVATANPVGTSTRQRRRIAFTVGFLCACAVAMFVWLTGLGWAAVSVAKWLLS